MTTIQASQLWVYVQSRRHGVDLQTWVDYWAGLYRDPNEPLYTNNINTNSPDRLEKLFKWKDPRFFKKRLEPFENRCEEARNVLEHQPANCQPCAIARQFLRHFTEGGGIFRIFFLHCLDGRFPIYDQHVHRAMKYLHKKQREELEGMEAEEKVDRYLNSYLPFFDEFASVDDGNRKVDKALVTFGSHLLDLLRQSP